jgi:hypothetical protein
MPENDEVAGSGNAFMRWVKALPAGIRQAFQGFIGKGGKTHEVFDEAAKKWVKSGASVHHENISEGDLCTNIITAQTPALNAAAPKRQSVTFDPQAPVRKS